MKKYTFFLGLKDKDSKQQLKADSHYQAIVQEEVARKLGGGTISKATGVFMHDDGTLVYENSLKIESLGFHDEQVYHDFAIYLRDLFNQESVLLETSEVDAKFI